MPSSTYFIIAGNLLPLFMCGLGYWRVDQILPLYWSESAIVGSYTILKILLSGGPIAKAKRGLPNGPQDYTPQESIGGPYSSLAIGAKLFISAFFTFHFGMFMFVHGVFLFGFVLQGARLGPATVNPFSPDLWLSYLWPVRWGILSLAAGHGASFFLNYIKGGEYRNAKAGEVMMQPYSRIIVMHLTILGGAFLAIKMRNAGANTALFAFVALKIFMDVKAHLKEHAGAPEPVAESAIPVPAAPPKPAEPAEKPKHPGDIPL